LLKLEEWFGNQKKSKALKGNLIVEDFT
jgi:hypothetical protein